MQYKKALLLLAMIACISMAGCKTPPIKIVQSEIEAVFSPGRSMRLYWDNSSQPVNIGGMGGPNVYDFSNLPFQLYDSCSVFSVTQIPQLVPRFPSTSVTTNEEGNTVYPVFSFSNNKFYREGRGRIPSDTSEWYQHISPADEFLRFPVTFNTQFSVTNTVVAETTYVRGIAVNTSSDTSSHTDYVDGYGTMLLPGGLAFECLRIRIEATSPKTSKEFHFWTREGAVVLVSSDKSQPDTGAIQREFVIYFSPVSKSQNTPN